MYSDFTSFFIYVLFLFQNLIKGPILHSVVRSPKSPAFYDSVSLFFTILTLLKYACHVFCRISLSIS